MELELCLASKFICHAYGDDSIGSFHVLCIGPSLLFELGRDSPMVPLLCILSKPGDMPEAQFVVVANMGASDFTPAFEHAVLCVVTTTLTLVVAL
jgi:hypothetical protein